MRSSRRRVKSPVGNMIKRGAELEGTPRTPRTLDFSPVRSISANGSREHREQNDHNRQPGSRKPLNWSASKQGFNTVTARNDDTPENPLAPRQQERSREQGAKSAEIALSPICVNAITVCAGQQGERNSCKKISANNITKASSNQSFSPNVTKFRPDNNVSRTHGQTDHLVTVPWTNQGVYEEDGTFTEGSYLSSPDCRSSWLSGAPNGNGVVIWNNAAFQPASIVSDKFYSRDSGSHSSSSASSSKWGMPLLKSKTNGADSGKLFNEAAGNGGEDFLPDADCEIEDYSTDADSKPDAHRIAEDKGGRDDFGDGIVQFDGFVYCVRDNHGLEPPNQLAAKKDEDEANVWSGCTDRLEKLNRSVARKVLFVPAEIAFNQSAITVSPGPPLQAQRSGKSASAETLEDEGCLESRPLFFQGKAREYNEDAVENGEKGDPVLGLSKTCIEVETCKDAEDEEVNMNAIEEEIQRLKKRLSELQLQKQRMHADGRRGEGKGMVCKGSDEVANGRGKGGRGGKIGTPQSPRLLRRCVSLGSSSLRGREDRSVAQARMKVAGGSCRSADSTARGRRLAKRAGIRNHESLAPPPPAAARGGSPPANGRAPPLRIAASPVSEKKNVFRRLSLSSAVAAVAPSPKPAPRFVSSRYGQPPTPDPPPSKKRLRASSTPRNPPASNSSPNPLKKLTTIRSGYPSPIGFSTPLKSRTGTSLPPSSDLAPATSTPPRSAPRVHGIKSTAALSECLESLVQDTKQFFQRYPKTNACNPGREGASAAKFSCANEARSLGEAQQGCSGKLSVRRRQVMLQLQTVSTMKPFETPRKGSLNFVADGDGLDSERRTLPRINTSRMVGLSPRDSGCVKRMPDRQKKQSYFAREETETQ